MSDKYSYIINLQHPCSPTRAHMSRLDRAAQFNPFAALTGYDTIIDEAGKYTAQMAELNEKNVYIFDEIPYSFD